MAGTEVDSTAGGTGSRAIDTGCVVVGGGPAGMVLGLLLARAGVAVTVLEKHADFLRDFRGDTVHASTLTLLDELGLGEEFARLPRRVVEQVNLELDGGSAVVRLDRLPGPHKHIAMVPQWDFLELLATAAQREPTFTLIRDAEVTGLISEGGRVAGVRYRDRSPAVGGGRPDGAAGAPERELRAPLTVGCDGRSSVVRDGAGLPTLAFGTPMDVWWFRIPRREADPVGAVGRLSTGHMAVMLDRGDYWQCAYVIRKGSDARLRAAGIEALRSEFGAMVPWVADRLPGALRDWDDVKLLDVKLDRVRRWYAEGVLLIGDAAHAMSPVGGVGINLAVQDAVAAARLLAGPLRTGHVGTAHLAKVQRRRWWPTVLIQTGQRLAHRLVLADHVSGVDAPSPSRTAKAPLPLRLLRRFPALSVVPGRLIAIGPLPEHAPEWARRDPAPTA